MIQINLYSATRSVITAFFRIWNWLDTVELIPVSGNGITFLDLFVAVVVFDVLMFLLFGFMGWNDGGED